MLADELDYVVGVDTHRDEHALVAAAAPAGGVVGEAGGAGKRTPLSRGASLRRAVRTWQMRLGDWGHGQLRPGLARYLAGRGETVLELSRTPRAERRLRGKDDSLDAH